MNNLVSLHFVTLVVRNLVKSFKALLAAMYF